MEVIQTIDLERTSVRELNQMLHGLRGNSSALRIEHPGGRHSIAVGVTEPVRITVCGHVGYYGAGMNQNAEIVIEGNAGPGVAENIMSGLVRVKGNASQYAGASGCGGTLVIEGDASARCGISMKGVDIVVGGSVGHMSAFMAQAGNLVVCGDADHHLGDSIYEANIYIRGDVASLGADCEEKEMSTQVRKVLAELLKRAGFAADPGDFRRYGSARRLYHFNVDHADAY